MIHHVSWTFGTMKDTTWPAFRAQLFAEMPFKMSHFALHLKTINATNSNMRYHWIHTFQVKHVQIANFSPFLTFSVSDVDTPMDFHLVRLATDRT